MHIYDISQEVLSSCVFPGDPMPEKQQLMHIQNGDGCNLTKFSMGAHNGTHVDAPYHFFDDGQTVDKLSLEALVGECYVSECQGELSADGAQRLLRKAEQLGSSCAKRILLKGKAVVSASAAEVFAESGVLLVGNESQTVGDENAPARVHRILLKRSVVLLEGVRLHEVREGAYFLFAAPLNLQGADGSPCRAILVDFNS